MSSSTVEKIKERLDVADVIGGYVKLENAGASLKGCCPFHNEKTPSFFVSPARGTYYCFGCGAKGDIFTFVQEFEGLDFVGALKLLADKAGVVIETKSVENREEHTEIRRILQDAYQWFIQQLSKNPDAQNYLTSRGITEETVEKWGIGYAPLEWRALSEYLKAKGYSETLMTRAGIVKKSEGSSSPYDVFRGRIMFPIFDASGNVIAWSGRLFDEQPEAPKYINSPETELFKKSEVLYGLDKAKQSIRKKGYSILVEGQIDLVLCHQHGFDNAVATSGTALTALHLERVKRLSSKIMMVFDGDTAGMDAARKSAELALSLQMEAKIALLPNGKDPADVLSSDKEVFTKALKSAQHVIDFSLQRIVDRKLDARSVGKAIRDEILPMVSRLGSSIEESHFVAQIAKRTGIKEDAIWTDLRRLGKPGAPAVLDSIPEKRQIFTNGHIARRLIGIMIWQEGSHAQYVDPQELRKQIVDCVGSERFDHLLSEFDSIKDELVFEAESYYASKDVLMHDISELLINLEEDIVNDSLVSLHKELLEAEQEKDSERGQKTMKRLSEFIKKKNELSERKKSLQSNQ